MSRQVKDDLLFNTAVTQTPRNGVASSGLGEEISIRGTAGPYVVIGSNFAPGTTAADIESAMIPSGGEMQSCRIISSTPTVMAEMVFAEKHNAESVISTFNNKKVWQNVQKPPRFELMRESGGRSYPIRIHESRRTHAFPCLGSSSQDTHRA